MALRFIDGAGGYNTAQLGRKWTGVSAGVTVNATGGRRGGPSIRMADWTQNVSRSIDAQSTWYIGFSYKPSILPPSGSRGIVSAYADGFGTQSSVGINSTGTVSAFLDWVPGGNILGTSTAVITAGITCYLEIKFVIHDTLGSIEVRKDGVSILLVTNVDTKSKTAVYADRLILNENGTAGAVTIDFDDIYMCDNNGLYNNNFLGDLRIDSVFPNGAGATTGWTPSTGSNYQNVDDDPANDDTDYNSSGVAAAKDTYAFPDIPPTVGNVMGVVHNITVRKDDALTHTFRDVVRRGGTDYPGTTKTATAVYAMYTEMKETDPSTSLQWTIANLNAAEFGVELVS